MARPLIAMAVYAALAVCFSVLSNKSVRFRRAVEGKPVVLFSNGCFYRGNMKKSKIDLDEFLMQCRVNGYYELQNIQTALLEPNGKVSFLPRAEQKPVTPRDLSLPVPPVQPTETVISDGRIMPEGLKKIGKDEQWLKARLKEQGKKASELFLATADNGGTLCVFPIR